MGAVTPGGNRLTSITLSFSRAPRADPPAAIVAAPAVGLVVAAGTLLRLVVTVEAADIRPRLAVADTALRPVATVVVAAAVAADTTHRLAVVDTALRLVDTAVVVAADTGHRRAVADTALRPVATVVVAADTGHRRAVAGTALRLVATAAEEVAADTGHRLAVVADITVAAGVVGTAAAAVDTAAPAVVADTAEPTDTANTERVEAVNRRQSAAEPTVARLPLLFLGLFGVAATP